MCLDERGDAVGHPEPLGASPGEARAGRVGSSELPVLDNGLAHPLAELLRGHRRPGDAHDPEALGEETTHGERVERRHDLPLRQVARDDNDIGSYCIDALDQWIQRRFINASELKVGDMNDCSHSYSSDCFSDSFFGCGARTCNACGRSPPAGGCRACPGRRRPRQKVRGARTHRTAPRRSANPGYHHCKPGSCAGPGGRRRGRGGGGTERA